MYDGLSKLFRSAWQLFKSATDADYRRRRQEDAALARLPRRQVGDIAFRGGRLSVVDAGTVSYLIDEIFEREIYKFSCDDPEPYILDCGANIGMSILYFKRLMPGARIVAFEPDQKAFAALTQNVAAYGLSKVELVNRAIWKEATSLRFAPDAGSTAGRVLPGATSGDFEVVQTTPLRDYLDRRVNFLKIDIEGAEYEVLKSCAGSLDCVERIFVEYHSFAGQKQNLPALLQILTDSGFRLVIDPAAQVADSPFLGSRSHKSMDMLLNIYGIREGTA